ncbi:cytochrome P450 family protein [Nocardia stercoris]|uniref:Cytochrome P450 n=1 Tax=Nocardia stercoris TaxID=2483361 RepID=A0A3M2LC90_9NOCA|nr:cytochrome P450 [Nocardia stercoris]RMI35169.1 cytochrome P450 [Nocardia stercoris]
MTTQPDASGCPVHALPPVPLTGPRFLGDANEFHAELRRDYGPVVPVELLGGVPAWLVIGYRELHQVTTDHVLFPRDSGLWNQWPNIAPDWPLLPMVQPPVPSIYRTVGAEHRRHVAMVEPALESVSLYELRSACEELADRLIDSFCGRGSADLVAEFAEPLPALTLARVLGIPDAEGIKIARLLKAFADGGVEAVAAHTQFTEAMQRLLYNTRTGPGRGPVARMLEHPDKFTDEEYVLDLTAVTAAGHLPTADWIGNSVRLMLTDDRFAVALGGGRRSVDQAMNEVLWEDSPNQILAGRWAARDTRLAEQMIRAGDMLLLGLGAANGDPHVRQQIGSATHLGNNAHFAFSYGEYRCPFPAQQMAEVIARTAIEVLLDRLPDLDLAVPPAELVRRPSAFLRGMVALPVVFTPVRALGVTP